MESISQQGKRTQSRSVMAIDRTQPKYGGVLVFGQRPRHCRGTCLDRLTRNENVFKISRINDGNGIYTVEKASRLRRGDRNTNDEHVPYSYHVVSRPQRTPDCTVSDIQPHIQLISTAGPVQRRRGTYDGPLRDLWIPSALTCVPNDLGCIARGFTANHTASGWPD